MDYTTSQTGLGETIAWIERLMLGTVASGVAIFAVAIVGFMMLTGRLDWRRSAKTILGCFLIFGAPLISAGLFGAVDNGSTYSSTRPPELRISAPPPPKNEVYDP